MTELARNSIPKSLLTSEVEANSVPWGGAVLSSIERYQQYLKERFPLWQLILLSIIVSMTAALGTQVYLSRRVNDTLAILVSFAAVLLFLLRLRLLDDIKDLEHDRQFYPGRPVARGLVRPREVAQAAGLVFLLEALLATTGGAMSMIAFALVAAYSVLTFREFFARRWLRKHFTVYAVTHEAIVLPVCIYLYSLNGLTLGEMMQQFFYVLTAFIFGHLFLLEVTRKIRPAELSQLSQDTYTARYGNLSSCILSGLLALWVIITGIMAVAAFGIHVPALGYIGMILLFPVAFSLVTFVRRPDLRASRAVFSWSVTLVVTTGLLFILIIGFVL